MPDRDEQAIDPDVLEAMAAEFVLYERSEGIDGAAWINQDDAERAAARVATRLRAEAVDRATAVARADAEGWERHSGMMYDEWKACQHAADAQAKDLYEQIAALREAADEMASEARLHMRKGAHNYCIECHRLWPCIASKALAKYDALAAVLAQRGAQP